MDQTIYTITLADGTVISDLKLNGNNYISPNPVDPDIFNDNCSPVIIGDGETEIVHENMELIRVRKEEDGWWFILRDIPKSELERNKMQSDIDYLAMMTGVEL